MPRTLTVEQCYPLAQSWYEQATGKAGIRVVDTSTFTVVAHALDKLKFNQIYTALSEMLSTVTWASREYTGKFRLAWRSEPEYGAYRLKVSVIEQDYTEEDPAWKVANGQTFGTHTIKLPKVYQAQIWGSNALGASVTISKKSLKKCLTSADEMARFFNMIFTDIDNQLEQKKEGFARSTVLSFAAGKTAYEAAGKTGHVYHLLDEYDTKYGKTYKNMAEIRAVPVDYTQFIKYVYARMDELLALMGNRDEYSHISPISDPRSSGKIMRHTPADKARAIINREYLKEIDSQVLTEVRNREYLKLMPYEEVLFWQSPTNPHQVKVQPEIFNEDGTTTKAPAQTIDELFAIVYDYDALGCGIIEEETADTPIDAQKKVYNRYWELEVSSWNDFTEKGFVVLMDAPKQAAMKKV